MSIETSPTSPQPSPYRGRFAPTPSGPLHLGSLFTALASWLDARANRGYWLLRIDDLDAARCRPEHTATILDQLEHHGLTWDEQPRHQSRHVDQYHEAIAELRNRGRLYSCQCSRAVLSQSQLPGPDGPVYPGTCRSRQAQQNGALRFRVRNETITLEDRLQGRLVRNAETDIGDFVVSRSDGIIGYQLSCVVDESAQAITTVVRGLDLLGSSFRQALLFDGLAARAPAYVHLPLLTGTDGRKLSKQNHADPIRNDMASDNLIRCLAWLGFGVPEELIGAEPHELLNWAQGNWTLKRLVKQSAIIL